MRPHRTDGISLSFGLVFLLVAVWWAISRVVTVHLPAAGWLVAGGLIMFGAIGLLGAIRSGRRPEVPAPVQAEAQVETPGDLPPEMHADIVRELLDNPADRVDLHPAYLKHPVPTPAAPAPPAPTAPVATGTTAAEPTKVEQAEDEPTLVEAAREDPTAVEAAGDEQTAEVTRVDPGHDDGSENDPDGASRRG